VDPRRERWFLFEKWYLIGTQMGGTPMVVPNKYYKYLIGTTPLEMVLQTKIQTENINTSKRNHFFYKKNTYIQNLLNMQTLIFFFLFILLLACVREIEKMTTQNRQQKM
jgi:hypothetical protein